MRISSIIPLLCLGCLAPSVLAQPVVRTTRLAGLPAVFRDRPADRLAAEEVARAQACARLLERIYGLSIDAKTDVRDLALTSRRVRSSLENDIRGVEEIETRYFDDGRVQVTARVKVREVVKIIEGRRERVFEDGRLVASHRSDKSGLRNRDHELVAIGFGALPDTPGMAKIRAMRAAEVDCCARLVAKVFGAGVARHDEIDNFAAIDSEIRSRLQASLLKGARFTEYEFLEDGTCRVTGSVKLREVVETVTQLQPKTVSQDAARQEWIQQRSRVCRDRVVSAVGHGSQLPYAPPTRPKRETPETGKTNSVRLTSGT